MLVFNYLIGFLALLGAMPIDGDSEIREHGPHTVWTVAGVLPSVYENAGKEVEKLFNNYVGICRTYQNAIKVNPYNVEIFVHEDGTYIYVSAYA